MQIKRRQRAKELPACLQKNSTPYLTTIHASRNNIRLSKPQRSVWPVCQSVFTHESTYPIGRGKKRTGRMFSRLSHVQCPVENHAQIPKRLFVMKGGTANIKNRSIFTRGVEVHNFGLGSVFQTQGYAGSVFQTQGYAVVRSKKRPFLYRVTDKAITFFTAPRFSKKTMVTPGGLGAGRIAWLTTRRILISLCCFSFFSFFGEALASVSTS